MTEAAHAPVAAKVPKASRRASVIETPWRGGLMVGVYGLTAILAYLAPLGFAPLVGVAAVLCLIGFSSVRAPQPMVWPWLGLAFWGLTTLIWSNAAPYPGLVLEYPKPQMVTGIKLVLQVAIEGVFILGAGQLCEASARRAGWVMALGMVALAAVMLIEARQGATIYQYLKLHIGQPIRPDLAMKNVAQGTYVLALLFWPAALCLISGTSRSYAPMVVGFMAISLGLSSIWFGSDAPLAALFLGLVVLFAVQRAGALACLGLTIASLAYWLLTPLVVLFAGDLGLIGAAKARLGPSWDARLDIWTFATDKIMQHPFRGWGLDASRAFGQAIPLHTHDGALQVWLELGVVGAVLMSLGWVGIFGLITNLVHRDRNLGAVAAASAVTYLLMGAVSFGLWQEWWLALGGLTFATIAMIDRARVSLRRQWQEAPSLERIQDKGGAQQLQQI